MLKRSAIAIVLFGSALTGGQAYAGACDELDCDDKYCVYCSSDADSGDLICDDMPLLEAGLICGWWPEMLSLPPQLVAPGSPEVRRLDLRTLQPQPPAGDPAQPRITSPNR